jgi:hypothetical protein
MRPSLEERQNHTIRSVPHKPLFLLVSYSAAQLMYLRHLTLGS